MKKEILYEAKNYHNIVFVGTDRGGVPKFASMRGAFARNGKGFKCGVAGNDKWYGFHLYCRDSREVNVFEAVIGLMSHITMFPTHRAGMVALGILVDVPLETFLAEHPGVEKIKFCLDNDGPERRAAEVCGEGVCGRDFPSPGTVQGLQPVECGDEKSTGAGESS